MQYHADTDESEHTTGIGSSPGLSASEVRGEVELCVLISSPRTLVERRRSAIFRLAQPYLLWLLLSMVLCLCLYQGSRIMALRFISRINLYTRISHYRVGCGVVDRYPRARAGVNGAVLQEYGIEPCCPQCRGYHNGSSTAGSFSNSTSRIALATGVVLMLGSAGKFYLNYLVENNLTSNSQFGFLKGRSAVLQLLHIMDEWTECLESGGI